MRTQHPDRVAGDTVSRIGQLTYKHLSLRTPAVIGSARTFVAAAALISCLVPARRASAQVPIMAMPPTYETYNNVTQAFALSTVVSYTSLNNSYVAAIPQVPTGQFSFISENPTAAGVPQFLLSTVPTYTPAGKLKDAVNAVLPAGLANTSFAGLLLNGIQWGGVDVCMTQCFSGGFAFNMQGSLQGTGAVAAPANAPTAGYTFSSCANYNEFGYGATNPRGQVLTSTNVSVGDFTQGWANNNLAGANTSMLGNYVAGYQNDAFTARGSGAATPAAYGFPNQVVIGPNLPPQPATSNNIKNLGFESPTYASSDALGNLGGFQFVNPFGTNNTRILATQTTGAGGVGPPFPNRWAVLMAPSAGDRTDFAIDIEREYAALIGAGVAANHIAVLYGNGVLASLRIPGSTPPVGTSSMLPANNFPNINTISNRAGGNLTTVPVQSGMDPATISGLLAGRAATWTGLGLAAPAAGANLLIYTTGHGGSLTAGGADLNISNERSPAGIANLMQINGLANYNPNGETTTIQLAMSKALPDLANGALENIWVDGVDGSGGIDLGAATQESLTDNSAYNISDLLEGQDQLAGGAPLFYYDVTVPSADLLSGAQSLQLSLESSSLSDVTDFDSNLAGITILDDSNMSDIEAGNVDSLTVTLSVPEPSVGMMMGVALLLTVVSSRRVRASRV